MGRDDGNWGTGELDGVELEFPIISYLCGVGKLQRIERGVSDRGQGVQVPIHNAWKRGFPPGFP